MLTYTSATENWITKKFLPLINPQCLAPRIRLQYDKKQGSNRWTH